jgi:tetratricopeptide (TPR) repeat protein
MHRATSQRSQLSGRDWLAVAVPGAITFAVFASALRCGFVNYDDPQYVSANEYVRHGLSAAGVRWALTTNLMANWHPLTWLSLQLDATAWGTEAWGFHLTNILLHSASAALLFLALRSMSGDFWRSAAVALLFAVHPLRVEPVAWIAERKGVLSVFFGMAALWAYAVYVQSPGLLRYLMVAVTLTLSLMSKQALVTFPFLMLVLDWWPLQRAQTIADWKHLVLEKLPLFALVIVFSVIAYLAQSSGGALGTVEMFPFADRLKNALVSYVMYLFLSIYPANLAVIYPHPGTSLALWKIAVAATVLLAVTAVAVLLRRRAPYLLAGWLWFLGTLVPVIGLVQVSVQAYADRYCYFPQIGLLIAICWGIADLTSRLPIVAIALGAVAALLLAIATQRQIAYWHDSLALWNHDIEVVGKYPRMLQNLGEAYSGERRYDDAVRCFREALEIDHAYGVAHASLGNVYFRQGALAKAAEEFDQAQLLETKNPAVFCAYGAVELTRSRSEHAAVLFRRALELKPDSAEAHAGLGQALAMQGQRDQAIFHLRSAVRCDPSNGLAHVFLGNLLEGQGDIDAAAEQFAEAVRLNPQRAAFSFDLGRIRRRQGRFEESDRCWQRAIELDPQLKAAVEKARSTIGTPK